MFRHSVFHTIICAFGPCSIFKFINIIQPAYCTYLCTHILTKILITHCAMKQLKIKKCASSVLRFNFQFITLCQNQYTPFWAKVKMTDAKCRTESEIPENEGGWGYLVAFGLCLPFVSFNFMNFSNIFVLLTIIW